MVITVNGYDWQVNIGCRTRLSASELLKIVDAPPPRDVLELASVSNRATLEMRGVEISPDGLFSAQGVRHRRGTGGKA